MGGMGGAGGASSSSGGIGGMMMADAGPVVSDGGDGVIDAGMLGTSSGFRQPYDDSDTLIPPGILIPGQSHLSQVRRVKSRKPPAKSIPPLRLPLYTYPRNVKP